MRQLAWTIQEYCVTIAYVVLSRVEYDKNYLIGGRFCPCLFVPAM